MWLYNATVYYGLRLYHSPSFKELICSLLQILVTKCPIVTKSQNPWKSGHNSHLMCGIILICRHQDKWGGPKYHDKVVSGRFYNLKWIWLRNMQAKCNSPFLSCTDIKVHCLGCILLYNIYIWNKNSVSCVFIMVLCLVLWHW